MFGKKNEFNPLVSIIIPVFNGSKYVREAIDSAINQTYKNIEILVINDGSTDNTEEIVREYGERIRYFKKKNGGTSTALNLGIKNMKGEYFSWLSHDDIYFPNKIERQVEVLSKLTNKKTILYSDLQGIDEEYRTIYKTKYIDHINQFPDRAKSNLYPILYNRTHGCTLLIPKVCFQRVGVFDEKMLVAQDYEFFYRAFSKFSSQLIPEILVTVRDSANRQGRRSNIRAEKEYSRLYISILNKLNKNEIDLLAPNKISFYSEMLDYFKSAGFITALKYLKGKIVRVLQISSFDLIGNKFNGYELNRELLRLGFDARQIVNTKESKEPTVIKFDFGQQDSIKKLMKQRYIIEADLIHLQLIHTIFDLNYLPIMSRLKPIIITLHDPYFLSGHCVHHFDCKKWQTHCFDCPYLSTLYPISKDTTALNFYLRKEAILNSKLSVIVASEWMENKIMKSPIWSNKKVYRVPFGVNQHIFKPMENSQAKKNIGIKSDKIILMFRSDPGEYKGISIIKNSLKKLEYNDKIVLITVGQKGLFSEFKKKFNIIEYGWIKDDRILASLYQACDIFLMPSKQETFGMMAVEAMSCAKVVLALQNEGSALSEIISSPNVGIAVKEHDYADSLRTLILNKQERLARGMKSAKYAQKAYSWEKYISKMRQIYLETINKHKLTKKDKLILESLKNTSVQNKYDYNDGHYNKIFDFTYVPPHLRLFRKLFPNTMRTQIKTFIQKHISSGLIKHIG